MRKGCTKSNILTMNHELVLKNSSLAAAYSLPNTIIYLKAIKYLNIRLRQIYWTIKCQLVCVGRQELVLSSVLNQYRA